jgi:hypothetical protein
LLLTGFLFLLAALARAHESPVDHVEREVRLWVEGNRLHFSYRVQQSERSVLMQLHKMDGNADGNISDTERDAFFTAHAARLAGLFRLELDGRTLKLAPLGSVRLDPRLGQTFLFTAPLPNLPPGLHAGHLIDDNSRAYPGPFRWISAGEGVGKATRVEPLVPPEGRQTSTHTAWMTLNFQIAVPE